MIINSLSVNSARELLPTRPVDGNKGTFGRALLICGSKNMVGCCVLAVKGALRSGAGLVTLAFPDVLYNALTSRLTENLFLPLDTDERGFFNYTALPTILDSAEQADVIMIGCGIGTDYASSLITTSLLECCEKPVIFDADALNCISRCPEILKKAKGNVLLTPHPGEMARLCNATVEEIQSNREKYITEFCKKYNVNVLLKGYETLICNCDATDLFINRTGNSGLSKGGSGDLLSGIIAGLTPSLGGDMFKAGVLGAFIHGMCADVLKESFTEYSMLPEDCASALPEVFRIIEKSGA